MTPYCEHNSVKADGIYELFSVVIHSGSTHSGHYTAYIRDVDDLGHWTHPVSSERYRGRIQVEIPNSRFSVASCSGTMFSFLVQR